ncbi:MAG: mannonate dehydratase [Lactobacillaceae bacterium]|jgi:mannonate dehydratase|nr:mannonate dehydratase [Lactobacillaceae bacterium]
MKMTFRWYGFNDDPITLEQVKQIPGMSGVVPALFDMQAGDEWPEDKIKALIEGIHAEGLEAEVIESVNISDDIKNAGPLRDQHIENYKKTITTLGKYGVKVICYNFMPVFDWLRTDLAYPLPDGSNALAYFKDEVPESAETLIKNIEEASNGFSMAGWEPERLANIKGLFAKYEGVTDEILFDNLVYFLEAIMPTCEAADVKMAIHPDDPPYSLFGLPRIINTQDNLRKMLDAVDNPYNGLTLCTGSLGANPKNDVVAITKEFAARDRVPFMHMRNIKFTDDTKLNFHESAHLTSAGSVDMYGVVRALVEAGWDGYVRPDHGRMIWGDDGRPGYGLYDRALGATYLNGLFEAVEKDAKLGAVKPVK